MWDKVLKFLNDNKDALGWLFGSGVVLAVLGGIYRFMVWLLKEYRLRKIRSNDNFPFKIIPPNSNVAKEILGGADDDPLADRNIPYQQRAQGRNTRRELEEIIEDHRWILITGRTGLGKTREAVQLAQSLSNEGWTILYLTRESWLDAPAKLPNNVPERKLLFFLDDLNKKCLSSRAEIRPHAVESLTLSITEPFQSRLQRTLEVFETFCGQSEIRVIASARNEKISEFSEPSEWGKLSWEKYSDLWNKFYLFDLAEPDKLAEQNLLTEAARKADISIKIHELQNLAKRNDGTFRNLVENLSNARAEKLELSLANFRDTLKGTWQKRYQKAINKFPEARFIYDSIELLNTIGFELISSYVLDVAGVLAANKFMTQIRVRNACRRGLKHLQDNDNILTPRDGQIEGKGYKLNANDYIRKLYFVFAKKYFEKSTFWNKLILLNAIRLCPQKYFLEKDVDKKLFLINNLLMGIVSANFNNVGISYIAFEYGQEALFYLERSIQLKEKEIYNPFTKKELARVWTNKGRALAFMKRYNEASESCKKAIDLYKNYPFPWHTLGIIYSEMGRFDDAVLAFNNAIKKNKKPSSSLHELGWVFILTDDFDNAIQAFKKAIQNSKKWPTPWNALGYAYMQLKQYDEAMAAYQQAISLNPRWATPWNNLGSVYSDLHQVDAAINACQKAIAISPKSPISWVNLAKVYADSGRFDDAESACHEAVKLSPKESWLLTKLGRIFRAIGLDEKAISMYKSATKIDPNYGVAWAELGEIYEDLDQFEEAVAAYRTSIDIEPDLSSFTWNGLGNVYRNLKKYDDAIYSYKKSIEIESDRAVTWNNLGNAYLLSKNYNDALNSFVKAVEISPNKGYLRASLVGMFRRLNRLGEAAEQEELAKPLMENESEYNRACFEAIRGNPEESLRFLKIALGKRKMSLEWVRHDPDFDFIRHDTRFKELVGLD